MKDQLAGRIAQVTRETRETKIRLQFNIDGSGDCRCNTGIGFFDHMIDGFARHGLFDIDLSCEGDLQVDSHHTVEDVGIVLGEAIQQALGEKAGIRRYGSTTLPMDDALVLCAVDLSGRPYFAFDLAFDAPLIGTMESGMVREFFYAISYGASMNLHLRQLAGSNDHHIAEAAFKAFAKALDMATTMDPRISGVLSTKGKL